MKARYIIAALIVVLVFIALMFAGDLSRRARGSFIADPGGLQR